MRESSKEPMVKRCLPVKAKEFGPRFSRTLAEIMPDMLRRAERIGYVNLHDVDSEIVQTDIDGAYSFVFGLYAATIFFASRAVEMAINADSRMRELKEQEPQKWLNLNRKKPERSARHRASNRLSVGYWREYIARRQRGQVKMPKPQREKEAADLSRKKRQARSRRYGRIQESDRLL